MPKQIPCLWFDGQAEQAAQHYTAIFPNSRIDGITRYGPDTPGEEGAVMTVEFRLDESHLGPDSQERSLLWLTGGSVE